MTTSPAKLSIKTLSGSPILIDAGGMSTKVLLTDATGTHRFVFKSIEGNDKESAIHTQTGDIIRISPEDGLAVSHLNDRFAPVQKMGRVARVVLLCLLGLLVLILIGAAISGASSDTTTATPQTVAGTPAATTPAAPIMAAVGQAVAGDKTEITVTKVMTRDKVGINNQFMVTSAAEGGVLVVIEYKIKNTSDKPLKSYDMPKLKLFDQNGTEYSEDEGKTMAFSSEFNGDTKAFSDLNPDIAVNDAIVFEVSKTRYNPATWHLETEAGTKIALQ